MDIKEIQNLIKFVAKSGASEVKLEMQDVKIKLERVLVKQKRQFYKQRQWQECLKLQLLQLHK